MILSTLQLEVSTILLLRDTPPFARASVSITGGVTKKIKHMLQSRMAERFSTTDLSGGKASADSSARLMTDLVAGYVVDFWFDPFSSVALDLTMSSEGSDCLSRLVPATDRVESQAVLSGLRGKMVRWTLLSTLVHTPLDSRFFEVEGTGVSEIEDSILRFGCE